MFNIVPSRFAEPKWQAYVTPEANAFVFDSGRKIKSLYDLKLALSEESEDIISTILNQENGPLANWLEKQVGNEPLAKEFRTTRHRWGAIVALERHMMRSLSLPDYIAKRWLATQSISFTFVSGEQASSLEDVAKLLPELSEETIAFHRERTPNDISKWIMDIIGDYQAAELLEEASNRMQMHHFLADHIEMVKEAAHSS